MHKKFVKNIILLLFLNLLIKPFWVLGIDRAAQNICGAASYGQYFALFNLCILFNIILDLGITNYNSRHVAQNSESISAHFSSVFSFKLLLGIFYLGIIFCVGLLLSYDSFRFKLLCLLAFNQFLVSMILYLRSNISGLHLFATDSFLSVTDKLLMIILAAILIWGNITSVHFNIVWFILVQTVAYLITFSFVLFVVIRHAGLPHIHFSKTHLIKVLKETFPFALLVLTMSFYYRMDAVMIDKLLPNGNVRTGIYAQAYRLLDAATMVGVLFAGILLPMFSRIIKKKESVNGVLKLSFTMLFVPVLALALCTFIFAEPLCNLLYHRHILESSHILQVLMGSFILIATTYILGTLLTANGSLKQLNFVAIVGVIINFVLNLILIPIEHSFGAALASLITQIWVVTAQIYLVTKIFKLKTNWNFLIQLFSFAAGGVILTLGISKIRLHWEADFVILFLAIAIWAFVTRFISLKNLVSMFEFTKEIKE